MERMSSSDELIEPGAHIEAAIEEVPDILERTTRFMRRTPEPITTDVQRKVCQRLASLASFEFPDTTDTDENMAHFIKGMQWGYGLALSSGLRKPQLHISRHGLQIPSEDRMTMLRDNIRNFAHENDLLCAVIGNLYLQIDPERGYPNSVFWGFASALYMVDQGERNKLAREHEEFEKRRLQAERAKYDTQFAFILREEEYRERQITTEAWYKTVDALQAGGLWPDGFWADEM